MKKIIVLSCMMAGSIIIPTESMAETYSQLSTSMSNTFVQIIDNKGGVSGSVQATGTNNGKISDLIKNDLPNSAYNDGSPLRRLNCNIDLDKVYNNTSEPIKILSGCINNTVYSRMENDIKYSMNIYGARNGFYSYSRPVKIRNQSASNGYEVRYLQANILIRANQGGNLEAKRLGVTVTPSKYANNIYITYENSKSVDFVGKKAKMSDGGIAKVYLLNGTDPATSERTLIDTISNMSSSFDANPDENGLYDNSGAKNLLKYASKYMNNYASNLLIVDYGNPIEPKYKEGDGEQSIEGLSISIPDRSYYRNECTGEGVLYNQKATLSFDVSRDVDRYMVDNVSNIENGVVEAGITKIDGIKEGTDLTSNKVSNDYSKVYKYDYNSEFSKFSSNLADPIGEKSSTPNNLFNIGSKDNYNDIDWSVYANGGVASIRDDSIIKQYWYEQTIKEKGYYVTRTKTFTGVTGYSNGRPITGIKTTTYVDYVPPVYTYELKYSCIYNTEQKSFCSTHICQKPSEERNIYTWNVGNFGDCKNINNNGVGNMSRNVVCKDQNNAIVSDSKCNGSKPSTTEACAIDKIEQQVNKNGGDLNAKLRVTLAWYNPDDLDIHATWPGGSEIAFNNRQGILDIDMNDSAGGKQDPNNPVENLSFKNNLPNGRYTISVINFNRRSSSNVGFTIDIRDKYQRYQFYKADGVRGSKRSRWACVWFDVNNQKVTNIGTCKGDATRVM